MSTQTIVDGKMSNGIFDTGSEVPITSNKCSEKKILSGITIQVNVRNIVTIKQYLFFSEDIIEKEKHFFQEMFSNKVLPT